MYNWKKEFYKKFNSKDKALWKYSSDLNAYTSCDKEVEQFISELRKKDMEELIKMLRENDDSPEIYFGDGWLVVEKLIKDYYESQRI
jgi:hypothetical protein